MLNRWLDLDQNGKVYQSVNQEGSQLTFGEKMFAWEERYAAAGEYMVGLVVEDLEGNAYHSLEHLLMR